MTGQDLLDRMELLNAELQLQSGEANVTKGLLALNVAQDFFESEAAKRAQILGGATGTVTTTLNTETTAFPSGVLRIDRLQLLNDSGRPAWDLVPSRRAGGPGAGASWPISLFVASSGKPTHYWTNGTNIYWRPLPSGTHTVRWHGFQAAANITAGGTFAYPDIVAFPLATFAVQLYKMGLDDQTQDISVLAQQAFSGVLDSLGAFQRDGAAGLEFTEVHYT